MIARRTVRMPCPMLAWPVVFSLLMALPATAQQAQGGDRLSSPTEPSNLLPEIDARKDQRDAVFSVSPLGGLRDATTRWKTELHESTGLNLGFAIAHVFQGTTESLPGTDDTGMATVTDFVGTWDLVNRGEPTLGQAIAHVQGRWDYGGPGPEDLGFTSLAGSIGTADTYAEYTPSFVVRNLYWRQGSADAGWSYRVGKITPDGILSASAHLDSQITFLPSGGVSSLAVAFPDSGWGAVGAWYPNDRTALVGLVSDANADRFDWGNVSAGDLFTGAEINFKIAPQTENAGYSNLTLWHTDGTKNGQPINAMTGESGWGFFGKYEQELTADGRLIGILRYGQSFEDSAFYEQQAGAHLLFYEPRAVTGLKNDLVGAAFNWAQATESAARDEYNFEVFYRFPIFPELDTTLSYQSVINPAFTRDIDHASVFSLRLRTVF